MSIFQTTMRIVSGLLSIYSLLIFIRIMLTWFHSPGLDRPKQILGSVVDPYLNMFRGIEWLRFGMMDFSPILAFILVGLGIKVSSTFGLGQAVTIGKVFAYLISDVWGFAGFFMTLIIIMLVIFLVANLMGKNIMLGGLNNLLYKITDRIMALFGKQTYHMTQGILISLILLILLRLILGFGFTWLAGFLYRL